MTVEFDDHCRKALSRLKPDWRPAAVRDVSFLEGGYSNRNYSLSYEGVRYVLRVVAEGEQFDHAMESPLVIDRLAEHRVLNGPAAALAPPLVAFALPEGHMLTAHVDGELLIDASSTLGLLAGYLAHLHGSLSGLSASYDLARLVSGFFRVARARGVDADPRAVEWLADVTPTDQRTTPCHNDLNPWNIIVPFGASGADPHTWYTLDWEFAGNNDPLFDVLALSCGLEASEREQAELVGHYCELTQRSVPDDDSLRAVRDAFFLREYAWALCQESLGNRRTEITEQRQRSLEKLLNA